MVLIFDLDDTLYEELSYVRSGFRTVAKFIHLKCNVDEELIFYELYKQVLNSRNNVFDIVFKKFGFFSNQIVKKSLSIYRNHKPDIFLYPDAIFCLKKFLNIKKFVVTDGNKIVQGNKAKALNLTNYFEKVFITHRYGIKYAKPCPFIFLKIANELKIKPQEIIYIGDNPQKDFLGIKPLGFKTIRLLRGNYKSLKSINDNDAHISINNLNELNNDLINKLYDYRKF